MPAFFLQVPFQLPLLVPPALSPGPGGVGFLAALGGLVVLLLGPNGALLVRIAVCVIAMDTVAGSLRVAIDPGIEPTWSKFYVGVLKKCLRFLGVGVGAALDWTLMVVIPSAAAAVEQQRYGTMLCTGALIGAELGSVIRNIRFVWKMPEAVRMAAAALERGRPDEALAAVAKETPPP